jgi:hypothetical protein
MVLMTFPYIQFKIILYNKKTMIKFYFYKNCIYKYIATAPFSTSSLFLGKKKPDLHIDTNPSRGNEGLDAEKEWRKKSSTCEHNDISIYEGDENDNTNPMLCDYEGDPENTAGQSSRDQANAPNKHPAVQGENDWAYLCNDCLAVICKDCHVYYPSEENTPVEQHDDSTTDNNSSGNNNEKENMETMENSSKSPDKSSLIDDFADTSCELPDYTAGDD